MAPAPFVAPDISALRVIAASRKANRTAANNALAHPRPTSPIIMQTVVQTAETISNAIVEQARDFLPSAPPLSELPSYEEAAAQSDLGRYAQTAIMQAVALAHAEIGTQTDAYEEAKPSLPSCNSQAIPSSSTATQQTESPFDETNEEYKKFLTNAREKHLEESFLALLNAAYRGEHKIAEELLNSPQCPEVGTLPLLAAIKGGSLETVQAISPFFTRQDAQTILVEPIHYGHINIFTFISTYWNFTYDVLFLEKALAYHTIDETFLDFMVSRGLNTSEIINETEDLTESDVDINTANRRVEKVSSLYMAIRLNKPDLVSYFLEKRTSPFTVKFMVRSREWNRENYKISYNCFNFFLAAAKTPPIKKMLMDRERLDREKLNKTHLELEQLKQESLKLEQERQKEQKEQERRRHDGCTIQ
jgi:hypothetical protein